MVEQRLLGHILGDVEVAQDPVGHRVKAAASGDDEAREGPLVAMLCRDHELGVHVPPPWRRPGLGTLHTVWVRVQRSATQWPSSGRLPP